MATPARRVVRLRDRGYMNRDGGTFRAALAAVVATVGLMPPFFVGALAVSIAGDLRFGSAVLGVSVAAFYFSCAVFVAPLGRLVDRIGASRSLRIGLSGVALGSLAAALLAEDSTRLIAALAGCGVANALVQPAANRMLVRSVGGHRLGLGFGIKQSAPPAASMIAGFLVPAFAAWNWRAAFGLLAILALGALPFLPRPQNRSWVAPTEGPAPALPYVELIGFAVTLALGSAAASSVTVFFVNLSVASGFGQSHAGVWLGLSSALALATRVLLGFLMDRRRPAHFRLCGWMLVGGSAGIVAMATLETWGLLIGLPVALIGTWGFNGVFWYAVMRRYGSSPGGATGVVFPGGLIGAVVGPLAFGLVADAADYRAALFLSTAIALWGGGAMFAADRRLRRPATAGI